MQYEEELLALALEIVLPKVRLQLALHNDQIVVVQGTAHIGGVLAESGYQETHTPDTEPSGVVTPCSAIVLGLQEDLLALSCPTDDAWPTTGEQQENAKAEDADYAEAEGAC